MLLGNAYNNSSSSGKGFRVTFHGQLNVQPNTPDSTQHSSTVNRTHRSYSQYVAKCATYSHPPPVLPAQKRNTRHIRTVRKRACTVLQLRQKERVQRRKNETAGKRPTMLISASRACRRRVQSITPTHSLPPPKRRRFGFGNDREPKKRGDITKRPTNYNNSGLDEKRKKNREGDGRQEGRKAAVDRRLPTTANTGLQPPAYGNADTSKYKRQHKINVKTRDTSMGGAEALAQFHRRTLATRKCSKNVDEDHRTPLQHSYDTAGETPVTNRGCRCANKATSVQTIVAPPPKTLFETVATARKTAATIISLTGAAKL